MEKVKLTTTATAPYHGPNRDIEVVRPLANRMLEQGWAVLQGTAITVEDTTVEDTTVEAVVEKPIVNKNKLKKK